MKQIALTIIFLLIASCQLEGNYEMDTYFPNEIEFVNSNNVDLHIKHISSAQDSGSIFVVDGKRLKPKGKYSTRGADEEAQVYRDLNINITASCEGGEEWSKPGKEIATITTNSIDNVIVVQIAGCN